MMVVARRMLSALVGRSALTNVSAARNWAAGPSRSVSSSLASWQDAPQLDSASASASAQPPSPMASFQSAEPSSSASLLPSPLEPSKVHRRTHNHHVASIQLRAYGHGVPVESLDFYADFALRAGYALGIPMSRPASLPMRKALWTVLRGPFVHKKSQENFERRTNKRLIKMWDADVEVVDKFLHFLRIHAMPGIAMRAEVYRNVPLSFGTQMLATSTEQLRSIPQEGRGSADEATLRASTADKEKISRLADGIIREQLARQDDDAIGDEPVIEATPSAREDKSVTSAGSAESSVAQQPEDTMLADDQPASNSGGAQEDVAQEPEDTMFADREPAASAEGTENAVAQEPEDSMFSNENDSALEGDKKKD